MTQDQRQKLARPLAKAILALDVMLGTDTDLPPGAVRDYLRTRRVELARLFTCTGYQFADGFNPHSASPRLEKRTVPHWLGALIDYVAVSHPDEHSQLMLQPFGIIPAHAQEDHDAAWWKGEDCWRLIDELTDLLMDNEKWMLE